MRENLALILWGKVKSSEKYSEGANQMEYCQKTYSF